ncbi:PAS domain-containing protein (plasmid) [Aliirhizobium terrae]|uniref:PAS domain-containing protein n=1 Tax=Terrirhizobium terrae TaxID=2926709 RepID=UPI002574C8DF|nr:PAS domain-containing protein [Rhizobium sp. CC-CFT758]WJH38427.1 PAS domain-containing protein [Rhizobium sp. CC-CFT758]
MRTLDEVLYVAHTTGDAPPEVGFFTWDVPENILYADRALADLFGLDPKVSSQGSPIEAYLDRVHPEDRSRLAKTIRDSIVADRPQQESYRVKNTEGHYVFVTGFGRGFRDQDGDIVRYVGIVIPMIAQASPTHQPH